MHKKRRKQYLSVLIIPDNEESPRTLRIRYPLLYTALAVLLLIGIAIIVGGVTYGSLLRAVLEKRGLEEENRQLKQELARVNELVEEMEELKAYSEKVRSTLQGYVRFVENPENQQAVEAIYGENEGLHSIFTSIPVLEPVARGFISQEFKWPVHNGIDIVAQEGTPIRASADGLVVFSHWTTQDGYAVMIHHDRGYFTYYKHNLKNLVVPYQFVRQGEVIALLGNSGEKSSGPHLHFEIWKDGRPVDPLKILGGIEN